ncbi:MAG: hypothetical protein ACE5LU_11840 [Anaerolineae bacterium]
MLRLNRYVLALVLWITFLFNVERFAITGTEFINISPPVYAVAVTMVALGLLLPHWVRTKPWHLQTIAILSFFIVKSSAGQPAWGSEHTYLSLFELIVLLITVTLAHTVGRLSADSVEMVRALILSDMAGYVYTPGEAKLRIKHEMQHSRRGDHPLSVIMMDVDTENARVDLHATAREIQRLLVKRYSTVALARLLAWGSRRTDFLLDQSDEGRLVLVAPRVGKDQVPMIISRLNEQAQQHLGTTLRYGVASFPDEGVTFEELIVQAEQDLRLGGQERDWKTVVTWPETTSEQRIMEPNGQGLNKAEEPRVEPHTLDGRLNS